MEIVSTVLVAALVSVLFVIVYAFAKTSEEEEEIVVLVRWLRNEELLDGLSFPLVVEDQEMLEGFRLPDEREDWAAEQAIAAAFIFSHDQKLLADDRIVVTLSSTHEDWEFTPDFEDATLVGVKRPD